MFPEVLKPLLEGKSLTRAQARAAMLSVMAGRATPGQIGAFLAALRVRGETSEEIVGFAQAMRERAVSVKVRRQPLLDTCGTGGDGAGTFNISTTVAFIAAGAGAAVAKHGNRSVSSRCGSADVLEALGVKTAVSPRLIARCVEEGGIGFLFAPALHPALRHAGPVRRELKTRTIFNLLGPLANPAGAPRQLMGVYAPHLVAVAAEALRELGSVEAVVVCSRDGLDEFSLGAPSVVAHVKAGKVRSYELDARSLGFARARLSALAGGSARDNAKILLRVLRGEKGPRRDVCLLNAAAALIAAGLAADWREGLERAAESIDGGRALSALETLRRLSHGR
ncbi:MAG: anthranilate phosphoribosyltransferase [Elusimicrobia bacterium]|nr:anthranilate phosphoribosyltransferase [Elusimicrobiota bacterium]